MNKSASIIASNVFTAQPSLSSSKSIKQTGTPSSRASQQDSLLNPALPFRTRFAHLYHSESLRLFETCQPTSFIAPVVHSMRYQPVGASDTAHIHSEKAQSPRSMSAALRLAFLAAPAWLGVIAGLLLDIVVLSALALIASPVIACHALIGALTLKDLTIDATKLSADTLQLAYQHAVTVAADKHVPESNGQGSAQFERDLHRQTMFIGQKSDDALAPLPKEYKTALSQMKVLCADEAGDVDASYLWAVTDLCSQTLLNEAYAQLLCSGAMRYDNQPCTVSFNGATTMTVRRLGHDAVSIRAEMEAAEGVKVGLLDAKKADIKHSKTPLRLCVEVVVNRPQDKQSIPKIFVKEASIRSI